VYGETIKSVADNLCDSVGTVILGKKEKIRLALVALFSGGNLLLEDIPGTGKTTLAKALAASLGLDYKRIQFTPDVLPSDVTGVHYFNMKTSDFVFRPGPVFTNILLADEINRTTPRTQSSLLECMQEKQVSIDGTTFSLPNPFFVIATQNPIESQGTFPLPEAQLDRFMMKISMGYPEKEDEMSILKDLIGKNQKEKIAPVCTPEDLLAVMQSVEKITISDLVREYVVELVQKTRKSERFRLGASPRAALDLLRASRTFAAMSGRDYVIPDDVQSMAVSVLSHRVLLKGHQSVGISQAADDSIEYILDTTPVPIH
jgi:MoxR-like ATPase